MVTIRATVTYFDKELDRTVRLGEETEVSSERAKEIIKRGLAEEVEGKQPRAKKQKSAVEENKIPTVEEGQELGVNNEQK